MDVIEDGTINVLGPFEGAKEQLCWGQVILICTRWFGEVNQDIRDLLKSLALRRLLLRELMGCTSPPLVNSDRKERALQIMQQLESCETMPGTNLGG